MGESKMNQQQKQYAIDATINALHQSEKFAIELDDILRDHHNLPPRPEDVDPFTWLVGGKKVEENSMDNNDTLSLALKFTLRWEGGYVNHPNDKGGPTNKGIIQATYNVYRKEQGLPQQSVYYITDDEVHNIYKEMYWLEGNCHVIAEANQLLAISHFDWCVNSGVSRGIQTLQYCLGVSVDGIWGNNTQAKFNMSDTATLLHCYNKRREMLYRRWGVGSQRVFLNGWLNRLNDLKNYLLKLE